MSEYKIIGTGGGDSSIVYPYISDNCLDSIPGDPASYVSKIVPLGIARSEKKIYDKLPDALDEKLYFKFASLCEINDLDELEIKIGVKKHYFNRKTNWGNLVITYVNGSTLNEYLCNFENLGLDCEEYEIKEKRPIISNRLFIDLLKAYLKFIELIDDFHRLNFIHGDPSEYNVMYNPIVKEFKLIDFGELTETVDEVKKLKELENFAFDILVIVFSAGCLNKKVSGLIDTLKPGMIKIIRNSYIELDLSSFSNSEQNRPYTHPRLPGQPPHPIQTQYVNTRELLIEISVFINELISCLGNSHCLILGGKSKRKKKRKNNKKKTRKILIN
jgi:tRNA A-37 threonylcarbamoyl transferase component Bud32